MTTSSSNLARTSLITDRVADSEHEMTKIPRYSVDATLSNDPEEIKKPAHSAFRTSRWRDCIRYLRLQILGMAVGRLSGWKARTERRKVAMYRSRRMAALHSLLQIIPLGGAIALLVLRWTGYWVGDTSPDSTSLQFVAKCHELLMQASLVEIMLCIIRTGAIGGFVPLGVLSGAMQTTQLSYLWSLDFLSIIVSPSLKGWRKSFFVVAIPTLLGFTALVGPSGAVLMIPRPGSPQVVWQKEIYNKLSVQDLYPSRLNKANGLAIFNPTDWNAFWNDLRILERSTTARRDPEFLDQKNLYLVENEVEYRTLRTRLIRAWDTPSIGVATIPTRYVANSFNVLAGKIDKEIQGYRNTTISVKVPHPVVVARCWNEQSQSWNSSTNILYSKDDGVSLATLFNMGKFIERSQPPEEVQDNRYDAFYRHFPPFWVASPEPGSHSIILVTVSQVVPSQTDSALFTDPAVPREYVTINCFTLSAYWITAEIQAVHNGGVIDGQVGDGSPLSNIVPHKTRPIDLDIAGIDALLSPEFRDWPLTKGGIPEGLAGLFAIMVSEVPITKDCEQFYSDVICNSSQQVENSESSKATFEYTATKYGYGYATTSASITLSTMVITSYCIITCLYIIYILVTGSASTAWNSAIELLMLALHSRKPEHLGHTSVGVDSIETFKQSVGIRVNDQNEVELVFAKGQGMETSGLRNIERNQAY